MAAVTCGTKQQATLNLDVTWKTGEVKHPCMLTTAKQAKATKLSTKIDLGSVTCAMLLGPKDEMSRSRSQSVKICFGMQ